MNIVGMLAGNFQVAPDVQTFQSHQPTKQYTEYTVFQNILAHEQLPNDEDCSYTKDLQMTETENVQDRIMEEVKSLLQDEKIQEAIQYESEIPVSERQQLILEHYASLLDIDEKGEQLLTDIQTEDNVADVVPKMIDLLKRRNEAVTAIAKEAIFIATEANQQLQAKETESQEVNRLQMMMVQPNFRTIENREQLYMTNVGRILSNILPEHMNTTNENTVHKQWNQFVQMEPQEHNKKFIVDKVMKLIQDRAVVHTTASKDQGIQNVALQPSEQIFRMNIDRQPVSLQMEEIYRKVQQIFSNATNNNDITKVAPDVYNLLKQWTALEKQLPENATLVMSRIQKSSFGLLWKNLVSAFQNKQQIQAPPSDSVVTVKDVPPLPEIVQQNLTERTGQLQSIANHMPLSKMEQYVIYVESGADPKQTQHSFRQQFESIIQSSRLFTQPNGATQLSITLNPANLGTMLVRMTEVDGEMMVKILVSTGKAQQMLEANLHQLKHMFSPHQVVIEKQDGQMLAATIAAEGEGEEQPEERDAHQEEQEQKQDREQPEQRFSDYFQHMLNEEV